MRTFLFTTAGVGLLLLVAYDVYATVLHASARYGPIGERLDRLVWRTARSVAFRLSRIRRHKLLNAVGPVLLPLLLATYVFSLIMGFALVYYPHVPELFIYSQKHEGSAFMDAVYFSGISLTTAGYGDIVPRTSPMRALAVAESATGVALISLTITYLLSVYGALEKKRAVALSFYHQAGEGADAAGYIAHHFVEGRFYGLRDALRTATRDMQGLLESHVEHPVIHYFHPAEVYKSLPRMLFLLLESCAIIHTSLDRDEYAELRNYPEVRTLEANTRHVLSELVASLDLERRARPRDEERPADEKRWARRYRSNLRRLAEAGIKVRGDGAAGLAEYRERRKEWESKLQRLSNHLGYDWDEITGDTDPEYAADEEKEEPGATTLDEERPVGEPSRR
ncbi:MAG TPA: potassium channel family protein [Pyrinomonadaceae bacterium]|nr:potassium channel family protein [Pyrinomonadaceae bacterium]